MTIHTYIVEEPSTAEGFKDLLFATVKEKNLYLPITARRVSNLLNAQESSEEELKKFVFRIYEIHPDPEDFFLNAQDAATKKWVHLTATVEEKISFTLVE